MLGLSWEQIGTILFFGGFSFWAMKWAGRNLRALLGDSRAAPGRTALSKEQQDAIVARGLATPLQLFEMSPAEQALLAQAAVSLTSRGSPGDAPAPAEAAPPVHCPQCGTLIEEWPRETAWRCICGGCGSTLVLRRDGKRLVLSYTPPD